MQSFAGIDKIVHMGYMADEDVQAMIEHYFQGRMTVENRAALSRVMAMPGAQFTPAVVEQITIENDDIASMIRALEVAALARSVAKTDNTQDAANEEDTEGSTMSSGRKRKTRLSP